MSKAVCVDVAAISRMIPTSISIVTSAISIRLTSYAVIHRKEGAKVDHRRHSDDSPAHAERLKLRPRRCGGRAEIRMKLQSRRSQPKWKPWLCFVLFSLILAADAQTPHAAFEVATVKPAPHADPNTGNWSPPGVGKFTATHVSLALLVQLAYGVGASQIARAPEWFGTNLYDVLAKPEAGIELTRDELKPRLQALLRERFHLVAHTEMRSSRGYALVVAKGGAHLTPAKGDHFPGFRVNVSPGEMRGANWSMAALAKYLTPAAGFPVVDQTGLNGSYDIAFSYAANPDGESTLPSLLAALKEATGLLLRPEMVPVETIVIDSVDRVPTEN